MVPHRGFQVVQLGTMAQDGSRRQKEVWGRLLLGLDVALQAFDGF